MRKKIIIIISIICIILLAIIFGIILKSKNVKGDEILNEAREKVESTILDKKYIDSNISKLDKESATNLIKIYEEYQENNIDKLYEEFKKILLEYNEPFDVDMLNNIENINDENLVNILNKIRTNGYKFKQLWGDIIVVKDYSQYVEYIDYVSEDMKIYIEINNKYENQLYSFKDRSSLLTEIIEVEKSIKRIKDDNIKNDSYSIYESMILLVIEGDEIYVPKVYGEEESKKLNEAIQNCINQNQNTVTANILTEYLKKLENDEYENGEEVYVFTEELEANISNYFNK